jgi:hypothetical protein
MDVLFLDFDGVLHPGDVWYERATQKISLRSPFHELFESAPVFEAAIARYPNVQLVLSTSWVRTLGYTRTRAFLPEPLQARVIGTTYEHPEAWRFDRLSRYDAIALDVKRRRPTRWLAVDDTPGWPESERDALALIPTAIGLACTAAQAELHTRLAARFP